MIKFSLIVPLAPGRAAEILECIKNLKYPKKEFEVIVEEGLNASENRNRGIEKAQGEYLVFLDDDAMIKEDYINKIKEFFEKVPDADIVGGPQLTPLKGENFFAKVSGAVLTSSFGAFRVNKRYRKAQEIREANEGDLTSANLCIKKSVFDKIKKFDTRLYPGEDPELIIRAKKNNLKVLYNPEMIIFHRRRAEFPKYIKQIFYYGFSRPKLNKISGETRFFFLIPMFFLIYFSLIPFLSFFHWVFIIPMFAYAILAILFGIIDSFKNKKIGYLPILIFLYLFTHLSYGFGMLLGYLNKK